MPTGLVKKIAADSGKSVETVERIWDEAKRSARKKFKGKGPRFYKYATSILMKRTKHEGSPALHARDVLAVLPREDRNMKEAYEADHATT